MILAVSNSTILSNFALAKRPDLLLQAFPGLVMPTAVWEEIGVGERLGLLPKLDWSRIPVVRPDPARLAEVERSKPRLDRGEAACIALARAHGAVVVTDDRDARRVAQHLGLKISGTLGALILLVQREILTISEADAVLATMIKEGYRSPSSSIGKFL